MNYWKIQAVSRRKIRARNDIMGLLENNQRRKRKTKKTQPVIRKQFGIFAKSLTFNVRLNENNEYEPIQNDTPKLDGRIAVQKPIERANKNTVQKRSKGKKNGGTSVAKNRMQEFGFDVVDLIDDNITTNDPDQHGNQTSNVNTANDQCQKIPPKRTPHPNPARDKATQINQNIQKNQSENEFQKRDVNYPEDFSRASVDFTLDVTAQKSDRMRPIDTLDQHNLSNNRQKLIGSIDFNALDSHIGANNYKQSTNLDNFQSGFENQSTSKSFCKSVSDESRKSGWSLQTTNFSEESISSSATTETSFHVKKRTEQSNKRVLADISETIIENDLIGISPFSQSSSSVALHHGHCFAANTNQNIYSSQSSVSSAGLSSFNSYDESTDENSSFHGFDVPIKSIPLTLRMVIGRKSLGAHRAYERIFGRKDQRHESTSNMMTNVNRILQQQTNGANRPQMPAKSNMPTTSLIYNDSFEKPIGIMRSFS